MEWRKINSSICQHCTLTATMKTFLLMRITVLLTCYLTFGGCELIKLLPDHIASYGKLAGPPEFRADRDEFPHQVALMVEHAPGQKELLCSGALIHTHFVLAAAHCFDLVPPHAHILVEAGEEMLPQIRRVSRVTVHPKYTPFTSLDPHDLALVQFRVPLTLGDAVQTIKLGCEAPQSEATCTYWAEDTAANHGREAQRRLMYASVPLLDAAECEARLDLLGLPLDSVHLCSASALPLGHASRSAEKGSGALLTQQNGGEKTVIGINGQYGLYIRIPWLCKWIREIIGSRSFELEL